MIVDPRGNRDARGAKHPDSYGIPVEKIETFVGESR
jgi:hypothetical protein